MQRQYDPATLQYLHVRAVVASSLMSKSFCVASWLNTPAYACQLLQQLTHHVGKHLHAVVQALHVTAKLESADGKEVYASADIGKISPSWSHPKLMLHSNATDETAQLTLYIQGSAEIAVRLVSLFPAENVEGDVLQPFRPDLLQYLKDLQPRSDTFSQLFFPILFLLPPPSLLQK